VVTCNGSTYPGMAGTPGRPGRPGFSGVSGRPGFSNQWAPTTFWEFFGVRK
jgi:hypothetical protein